MKIDEIKGATAQPKDAVKVETVNGLKVILTKDDLGAMINAIDVIYNLMDDTNTATLKMEGSKETGTFWDVSATYSERGATTPFYQRVICTRLWIGPSTGGVFFCHNVKKMLSQNDTWV